MLGWRPDRRPDWAADRIRAEGSAEWRAWAPAAPGRLLVRWRPARPTTPITNFTWRRRCWNAKCPRRICGSWRTFRPDSISTSGSPRTVSFSFISDSKVERHCRAVKVWWTRRKRGKKMNEISSARGLWRQCVAHDNNFGLPIDTLSRHESPGH